MRDKENAGTETIAVGPRPGGGVKLFSICLPQMFHLQRRLELIERAITLRRKSERNRRPGIKCETVVTKLAADAGGIRPHEKRRLVSGEGNRPFPVTVGNRRVHPRRFNRATLVIVEHILVAVFGLNAVDRSVDFKTKEPVNPLADVAELAALASPQQRG